MVPLKILKAFNVFSPGNRKGWHFSPQKIAWTRNFFQYFLQEFDNKNIINNL